MFYAINKIQRNGALKTKIRITKYHFVHTAEMFYTCENVHKQGQFY